MKFLKAVKTILFCLSVASLILALVIHGWYIGDRLADQSQRAIGLEPDDLESPAQEIEGHLLRALYLGAAGVVLHIVCRRRSRSDRAGFDQTCVVSNWPDGHHSGLRRR